MLAASVGEEVTTAIPELAEPDPGHLAEGAPGDDAERVAALPDVRAGDEEIARWKAEVGAMRAMYAPMARLQVRCRGLTYPRGKPQTLRWPLATGPHWAGWDAAMCCRWTQVVCGAAP